MAVAELIPPAVRRDFRLGDWLVRPNQNLLERDDTRVHLRPKIMDVLAFLADHGGEVVANEAILSAVWGKRFLARSALSGAVCELRETLGDDPQEPRYIETVAKRGYRLVIPVYPAGPVDGAVAIPPPRAGVWRRRAVIWAVTGVTAAALATAMVVSRHGAKVEAKPPRLVVLPFENLGSPDDAYFAAGITDEVTTRLARFGALAVISSESARTYRGAAKDLAAVAKELRVEYVLRGSVRWDQKAAGQMGLRVSARLIRTGDGEVLWADDYDGSLRDILAVQADIGRKVVTALALTLRGNEEDALAADSLANPEAYDAYLQGIYCVEGAETEEPLLKGVKLLERSVELDPAFAIGWSDLARVHGLIYTRGFDRSAARVAAAKAALARATELAPRLPAVRFSRLASLFQIERDFPRVLAELDRPDADEMGHDAVLSLRGYSLVRLGRAREGVAAMRAAFELSPREWSLLRDIAGLQMGLGEFAESFRGCQQLVEETPDRTFGYFCSALNLLFWKGSVSAARTELEKVGRLSTPGVIVWRWWFAIVAGDYEGALGGLGGLPDAGATGPSGVFPRAVLEGETYDLLERRDLAVAAFERARGPLEADLAARPDDPRLYATLSVVYAGLGRADDAVRFASRAVALGPLDKDYTRSAVFVETLASVYVGLGDRDRAMAQLERLTVSPLYVGTIIRLSLDPRWRALHADPRFQRLLERARAAASPAAD